ncbi:MAG: Ig-like domain-containing protein [Rubripirellula sp.]
MNIDFGETVVGFTASDVAAVGATVGGFVDNGNGQFTATITSSSDGQVTLFIPAGAASDEAGNDTAASTILTLVVDTAAPAPSLRLFSAASNQSTFDVEVDFGETVNGFEVSDLVLSSGQVENLSDLGSGRFLARIAGAADGAFTLSLGAGAATDDAGNPSLAADDLTRTTDTGAPLPQLSTSEPTPTTNSSFTVTVDFGEPVTGLDADDVTVVNGSVIGVTPIDAQSFQLNVAATADGPVTVEVLAAASSDLAGNVSLRSQPLVVVFDAAAPVPVIGTDQPSTTGLTTFEITIDFGEPVTGFESSDLTLANATAATEVDLGQGRYEVTLTAISDGPVTIGLPAGAASDVAGRTSLIGNDLQIVVDSQGFNAVLSTTEPSPTNNATFDVLVDFGKDVSGFQASDLVIANGTAGQVTEQTAGSFLVPITATSDGEVTVSVPAGAVVDGTDRGNLPSSTLIINVDRMAPAPMLSTTTSSPTSRSQFDVVIDFGEAVIGFEAGDMQVTGGSVGELREVGDGLFLVPIQPFGDGTLTIEIADGVVVDSASNANTAATPLSIVVDRTAPQATLTTSESNPTTNQSFEVTIDFGEEVLGLVLDDLQVSGGTARDLIDAANGRFTVTIDAQADTNVSIELPEGVATDAVGNANVASTALEITVLDDNPRDFGDAPNASQSGLPSSYPTLLGDNGATHVVGDLFLGGGVTAEVFGQPTALADGDTDDGVRFVVTALASPTNTTISSLAVDASGAGLVDGWIDFNRDGDWNDPGEQIFNSQSVTAGTNLLPYTIPAGASPGDTYARFRLSSVGGLAPTGAAEDGEVEDHLLTLVDTTTRPEMVAKLDGVDSLEVVVSDSEIQLVDGTTILARADKSDTSGITIQDQNDDTITRVAADSMSAGAISVDLANGRSVLRLSTSQLLDLTALASTALQGIDEIDLTEGDHELILNVQQVAQFAANGLTIVFDIEDVISVGDGWQIDDVQLDNGQLLRRIIQDGSIVRFDGPDDYTNPINVFDVNQSGTVTANDALNVINELARGQYSASDGSILDPGTVDLSGFRFYDVTRDLRITALDALRIINELARVLTTSEAEAPMFDQPTSFTKQQAQTVHSVTEITPPNSKLMDAGDQEASPATQRNLDTTSDQNAELEAEAVDFVLGQLELEQQV